MESVDVPLDVVFFDINPVDRGEFSSKKESPNKKCSYLGQQKPEKFNRRQ